MKPYPALAYTVWVTVLALVATIYWGFSPIRGGSFNVFGHSGATGAEIIRQATTFRLVQPERVGSTGDDAPALIVKWQVAEIQARVSVLAAVWVLAVILILHLRPNRRGAAKAAKAAAVKPSPPGGGPR